MNIRVASFIFTLAFAPHLFARNQTDVVIMKNGDRLTCEIKRLQSGILYVDLSYVDGTLSVQWSKVARIESKQLFIAQKYDGTLYTGTLATAQTAETGPMKLEVVETRTSKVVIDQSDTVRLDQTSESVWRRFSGGINTGLIYSKANNSAQYSLGSQLAYRESRWSADAAYTTNFSASSGASTATRNNLNLKTARFFRWNNWFYAGLVDFLQSSEQGIKLQTTVGMGVGRMLKNTNRCRISVIGGGAWQSIDYKKPNLPEITQNQVAALFAAEAKVFIFKKTNLDFTAVLLPSLSQPGRFHFSTNSVYYVKLFGDIDWNFSFYGNWDTKPPAGFAASDYGSSSGLSWSFGR